MGVPRLKMQLVHLRAFLSLNKNAQHRRAAREIRAGISGNVHAGMNWIPIVGECFHFVLFLETFQGGILFVPAGAAGMHGIFDLLNSVPILIHLFLGAKIP